LIFLSVQVIGIYFYELRYRSIWEDNLHCNRCPRLSSHFQSNWIQQPSFTIYMLKYFFLLIVGITTGLWINLNSKTYYSWKRFFCCQISSEHLQVHRYGSHQSREPFGVNYSYKHTKINGSKYSLPSSKQVPLAHI